jgi:ABC-2 type transport system ATP-binding protein
MITVESVTKRFGSLTAVDDVSFSVERDEIVGFVGPNGAGKSTMLKMLSTFLLPTAGRIAIDGLDAVEQALAVRRRIGYLAGDTPLYQEMRVDKFLRFVGQARGLRGEELRQGFDRAVEICSLDSVLMQRIGQCSTGFRQRVGLATALIHDPPILMLDEPTHGFDPLQVLAFREMLRQLRPGRAILFSTHIVAEVEAVSDRVLIINQGKLLGNGSVAQLGDAVGKPGASLEDIFAHLAREEAVHG